MINRKTTAAIAAFLLAAPSAAQAECLGPNCYAGLGWIVAAAVVVGLLGIVLLIWLMVRWGRGFRIFVLVVLAATIGLPLLSQAWLDRKVRAMEAREVVGAPPLLSSVTPLLIASKDQCSWNACEAILRSIGPQGIIVLPLEVLEGLDLSAPLDLASLPLQNWAAPPEAGGSVDMRRLSPVMASDIAPKIDYLIYTRSTEYDLPPGVMDLAFAKNPALSGMRKTEMVRFAMAPLPSGTGTLSLTSLQFDLLDLSMDDRALGLPLMPDNWEAVQNDNPTGEAASRAVCKPDNDDTILYCDGVMQY